MLTTYKRGDGGERARTQRGKPRNPGCPTDEHTQTHWEYRVMLPPITEQLISHSVSLTAAALLLGFAAGTSFVASSFFQSTYSPYTISLVFSVLPPVPTQQKECPAQQSRGMTATTSVPAITEQRKLHIRVEQLVGSM